MVLAIVIASIKNPLVILVVLLAVILVIKTSIRWFESKPDQMDMGNYGTREVEQEGDSPFH